MNLQVQELLKKNDIQGSLEVLKVMNDNAKLIYADYKNEKRLLEMNFIDEEAWHAYLAELFIRIKQLNEEPDENESLYATKPGKVVEKAENSETKPTVFISYNHRDQEIVGKIARHLDGHIDYFVDYLSMESGDIIKERVNKEILDRDYFLVLISKNSLESPWVCLEGVAGSMKAQLMKGKVIPIRTDESLHDNNFIVSVIEQMQNKIQNLEAVIERWKKVGYSRKHLDTERELYVDFLKNYDTMVDTYRRTANVNISGDLFEKGLQHLIQSITKKT